MSPRQQNQYSWSPSQKHNINVSAGWQFSGCPGIIGQIDGRTSGLHGACFRQETCCQVMFILGSLHLDNKSIEKYFLYQLFISHHILGKCVMFLFPGQYLSLWHRQMKMSESSPWSCLDISLWEVPTSKNFKINVLFKIPHVYFRRILSVLQCVLSVLYY